MFLLGSSLLSTLSSLPSTLSRLPSTLSRLPSTCMCSLFYAGLLTESLLIMSNKERLWAFLFPTFMRCIMNVHSLDTAKNARIVYA